MMGRHRVEQGRFLYKLCRCAVRSFDPAVKAEDAVTGPELRRLRDDLGEAIGRPILAADMAKLCGLPAVSADTIRRWDVTGPSGPAAELFRILAMASDHYPILDKFNVFDRWDVPERERPARREEFREQMRSELRRRLG